MTASSLPLLVMAVKHRHKKPCLRSMRTIKIQRSTCAFAQAVWNLDCSLFMYTVTLIRNTFLKASSIFPFSYFKRAGKFRQLACSNIGAVCIQFVMQYAMANACRGDTGLLRKPQKSQSYMSIHYEQKQVLQPMSDFNGK